MSYNENVMVPSLLMFKMEVVSVIVYAVTAFFNIVYFHFVSLRCFWKMERIMESDYSRLYFEWKVGYITSHSCASQTFLLNVCSVLTLFILYKDTHWTTFFYKFHTMKNVPTVYSK